MFQELSEVLEVRRTIVFCGPFSLLSGPSYALKAVHESFLYTVAFSYCIPSSDDNFRVG